MALRGERGAAGRGVSPGQAIKNPQQLLRVFNVVASTGFEPAISALRGRRPKPLDDEAICKRLNGWGGRSRTLTYGTRNRCPTIRRHPNDRSINGVPITKGADRYITYRTDDRQASFSKNFGHQQRKPAKRLIDSSLRIVASLCMALHPAPKPTRAAHGGLPAIPHASQVRPHRAEPRDPPCKPGAPTPGGTARSPMQARCAHTGRNRAIPVCHSVCEMNFTLTSGGAFLETGRMQERCRTMMSRINLPTRRGQFAVRREIAPSNEPSG